MLDRRVIEETVKLKSGFEMNDRRSRKNMGEIVKRSIFRQSTYKMRYEISLVIDQYCHDQERYVITKRLGPIDLVKSEVLYNCDLTMPLLKVGEKFYIEHLDRTVVIKEAIRTSKDGMLYEVDPIIFVKDDETDKTYLEATKRLEDMYKEQVLLREEIEQLAKESWLFRKLYVDKLI